MRILMLMSVVRWIYYNVLKIYIYCFHQHYIRTIHLYVGLLLNIVVQHL